MKRGIRLAVVLSAVLAVGVGTAIGGKPSQPPPSGKSIYYFNWDSGAYRMASDGSGKTKLSSVTAGMAISDARYDGSYWTVWNENSKLCAAPIEKAGSTITLLNDPDVDVWARPTFRPGTSPRVTYAAVVWTNGVAEAGIYEVDFSTDGKTITHVAEAIVESTVKELTGQTVPHVSHHDWLDADTIVYGDDTDTGGASGLAYQLYVWDLDPSSAPVALIAADEPLMGGGGVQFNSIGSKVIYAQTGGLYEVSTAGDSTPVKWVSGGSSAWVECGIDYLDDDTVVYTWYDASKITFDVYKCPRGAGASNLTGGKLTAECVTGAAR
jgi:hypothetical protein